MTYNQLESHQLIKSNQQSKLGVGIHRSTNSSTSQPLATLREQRLGQLGTALEAGLRTAPLHALAGHIHSPTHGFGCVQAQGKEGTEGAEEGVTSAGGVDGLHITARDVDRLLRVIAAHQKHAALAEGHEHTAGATSQQGTSSDDDFVVGFGWQARDEGCFSFVGAEHIR